MSRTPKWRSSPLVVVMGASGCGKSTVGMLLADRLGVPFIDGDDLHPESNIEKMRHGIPLAGDDRRPWLKNVGTAMRRHEPGGLVVACSALRFIYREIIRADAPSTFFVHLEAPVAVLKERIVMRPDHFMPVSLLSDQLLTLEPLRVQESGVAINSNTQVDRIVQVAVHAVHSRPSFD